MLCIADKDSLAAKSVDFFYAKEMIAISTFCLDEDLTNLINTMGGESWLITEKNVSPFLLCLRLISLAPQQMSFPAKCSERYTHE